MALILLADDDPLVCDIVQSMLGANGHIVGLVDNGRDAVRVVRDKQPDLIILDCSMPLLSGIEALREIRRSDWGCGIPAIILTARTGSVDENIAFRAGADDYLRKPFDPTDLLLRVDSLLCKEVRRA